jgi:hypothetical protein
VQIGTVCAIFLTFCILLMMQYPLCHKNNCAKLFRKLTDVNGARMPTASTRAMKMSTEIAGVDDE